MKERLVTCNEEDTDGRALRLAQIHVKWHSKRENRSNERVCRLSLELRDKILSVFRVYGGEGGAKTHRRIGP